MTDQQKNGSNADASPDPKTKSDSPDSTPDTPAVTATNGLNLARLLSFGLLLSIIILLGIVFYQVMAGFLVPMFLAALLVVVFEPFHQWFLDKFPGRKVLAAALTTLSVMLTVLVPLTLLLLMALAEGRTIFRQYRSPKVVQSLTQFRGSLKLTMPSAEQFRAIDSRFDANLNQLVKDEMTLQGLGLSEIYQNAAEIAEQNKLPWPPDAQPDTDEGQEKDFSLTDQAWQQFYNHLTRAKEIDKTSSWALPMNRQVNGDSGSGTRQSDNDELAAGHSAENATQLEHERERHVDLRDYKNELHSADAAFADFKVRFLGGPARALFTQTVNPSDADVESYVDSLVDFARQRLPQLGGATSAFVGSLLLGTAIMIFSLYFFLLDGEKMIQSVKGLSPLDDEHESELIDEFGRVSRAVVLATLLSALAQGLLAGIGFYFAGLESIFLLTLLSAVLAMVPFVGAASVWIPSALYLYFVDQNLPAAIGLAVYGVAVISMADNVIKPMVLHGQSNLHPLLALLSVIGGVGSLGPIGILVGPMVVVFLQTLLKILRRELDGIDNGQVAVAGPSDASAISRT